MMVYASVAVLVAIAALIVAARVRIASLQSGLAGGNVGPGCAVAQAAAVLVLALLILLGHFAGMF
jgi:hypothetical protein